MYHAIDAFMGVASESLKWHYSWQALRCSLVQASSIWSVHDKTPSMQSEGNLFAYVSLTPKGRPAAQNRQPANPNNMTLRTATFTKEDPRVMDAEEARLAKIMNRPPGSKLGGNSNPSITKPVASGNASASVNTKPASPAQPKKTAAV